MTEQHNTATTETTADWSWHDANGFTRIINVSGTMTGLGASITSQAIQQATASAMGNFVNMHQLQAKASDTISQLTGSEAGCLTASASAGISLSIAACITGIHPEKVEALPTSPGERNQVAVQLGHLCGYGAPITTAVELTGGKVQAFGQSTLAMDYQMTAAINENTAAALYVVSHHVVHYGQIPFKKFVELAHAQGVPVIVDAASEYNLRGYIDDGADIVIYSGHKFLGGPTAGIIAGKRDLVKAAYIQNLGIGRGMKIGKESLAGTIAAMQQWLTRDHDAIRSQESAALDLWLNAVHGITGITAARVADPTGNPLERLQITVDETLAGASAGHFASALAQQDPVIIVRNHEVELNYFQLDPCNLKTGQALAVADALQKTLADGNAAAHYSDGLSDARNGSVEGYLAWLK